jgi:Protein of unknown function (DUF2911)
MKLLLFTLVTLSTLSACAQPDKSKRPSPPALAKETLSSGAAVSIDYSQPSVKGRIIGKDLEPKAGQVWRTGANEATVFETDKAVKIEGKELPAGKYGLFTIANGDDWTIIFNKTWKQWGAYDYKEADDALRVNVKASKASSFAEKMTFSISKDGKITLLWGDISVGFTVQ